MAVTEMSGDGYALYNGVRLPDINAVWTDKETYPYACISQLLINDAVNMYGYKYILLISSTQFFKITNDSCETNDRMSLAQVYTLKNLSWGFEEQHDGGMSCENESLKCIWTSHDIYSFLDLTIHLAASEPVPLDNMNIIEWDGDTTDLETFNEMYKVSDTIIEPNIVQKNGAVWLTSTGNVETYPASESNYQEVSGTWLVSNTLIACGVYDNSEIEATTGLYFEKDDSGNYISLFAYNPVVVQDESPTVIFDLRSWLMGFALGIAGKPLPFGRALWYSYNGTILNALPYWNENKYPYAVITSFTILDTTAYKLWLFEEPMMVYSVEGSDLPTFRAGDTDVSYMMDTCKIGYSEDGSNKWEGLKKMTITANSDATTGAIVWSNYDMMLEDGTVYVEGSEPVPYCGKMVEPEQPSGGQDDLFPIEWNNQVIKNNTSIELEGLQLFKISDSIPTSDELTNLRIIAFNDEGRYSFAFDSVENIGSMNVFIYTLSSAPLVILSVSENTDGYEPGLYVADIFEENNIDFTMYYAPLTFCLYNGVKMPDIETVWVDKQKYPYAFMTSEASDNGALARLYLTANPVRINTSEFSGLLIPEGGFVQYICTTDPNVVSSVVGYNYWKDNMMTGENDMSFNTPKETETKWANYDVLNADGSVYLAASEPVPVYE